MDTKEQILEKHDQTIFAVKDGQGFKPVIRHEEALNAMDEYAKQVAIAFADWYCNGVTNRERKLPWEMYDDFLATVYTPSQLFNELTSTTEKPL